MKTNLDKFFKRDKELEANGVWFDISDETGFLVRPFNESNPRVKAAMTKYFKPYAKQVELGTLDPDKEVEVMANVFVDVCLADWRGVKIDDEEAEFSRENAVRLFKSLPDLFTTLWDHSRDSKNYREELGNS